LFEEQKLYDVLQYFIQTDPYYFLDMDLDFGESISSIDVHKIFSVLEDYYSEKLMKGSNHAHC